MPSPPPCSFGGHVTGRRTGPSAPVRSFEITASRFEYDPAVLEVEEGDQVRLSLRSTDTVHGFEIKELKVKIKIPKGGEPGQRRLRGRAPGHLHDHVLGVLRDGAPPDEGKPAWSPPGGRNESPPWRALALVATVLLSMLAPAAARAQNPPVDDREIDPVQPDFVVVNLPTNLRIPRHAVAFYLTHRFSRPLGEGDFGDLVGDLFGFDSGAQVGLGLRFGLFTGTELGVYRTNDRAIQLSVKKDLFQQGERPLSLGLQGAVTGRDNFSEVFSPSLAAVFSRKLGGRATLYAVPAYAWNVSVFEEQTGDDAFLLGLGGRLLLGRGVSLVAEWTGSFGYDAAGPRGPAPDRGRQPLLRDREARGRARVPAQLLQWVRHHPHLPRPRGESERLVHRLQPLEEVLLRGGGRAPPLLSTSGVNSPSGGAV